MHTTRCLTLLLALLAAAPPLAAQITGRVEGDRILVPPEDVGSGSLSVRAEAQRQVAADYDVFHGFRFEDRLAASGITFEHRIVDDAGKYYKAVHYDHGNGLAAADVDGDGRSDLYFLSQLGGNELWRNVGGGRFENVTDKAGVGLADRVSVTASFGDVDNDGDPDLFVTTVKMGNVLFENLGDGRFRDVTEKAGVGHVGHSSGAVFFDADRDGWLDLFVTNVGVYTIEERGRGGAYVGAQQAFQGHLMPERTETSLLYMNRGDGTFAEASEERSLVDASWSGDATFTDLDGDLWPELYVLNMQGDDHYYVNREGRFTDRTAETFPRTPWGAMGVKFFDWNEDGRLDLYVTDMHSDMPQELLPHQEKQKLPLNPDFPVFQGGRNNVFGNAFWEARDDGSYREIGDQVRAETYWPWGFSVADLNADGWQDVFVTGSMNYPFRYGLNSVLLNERGETFRDAEFLVGVEPRAVGTDTLVPWFELDCSGADAGHDLCKDRTGRFTVYGNLGSRSSVVFDLDDDGDLDVVTNEFNSPPQVLVSNLAQTKPIHHLLVDLEGRTSNRDALGSWVTVAASGRTWTRYHDGKSGYLSQSDLPLYFGLGEADTVERIEVRWPSGLVQTVTGGEQGLPVNRRIRLVEPELPPPTPPR